MKSIRGVLTVKELREKIANLPDDMIVLTSGSDHSYRTVGVREIEVVKAEYFQRGMHFGEHDPDGYVDPKAEIIEALIV